MKLIIAGSRDLDINYDIIAGFLIFFNLDNVREIVSGTANGVDKAGENFTEIDGHEEYPCYDYKLILTQFPADWTHGKAAGPIRNRQMAEYADALLLIWDGKSRGSANMKSEMRKLGKPVYEVIIPCNSSK